MALNPEAVGKTSEPAERSWEHTDALLYALGVGAGSLDPTGFELDLTTENFGRRHAAGAADLHHHCRPGWRRGRVVVRRLRPGDARAR